MLIVARGIFFLVVLAVCVFCVGFLFCSVLFGCASGALLYESPGGNQVDGLPPAFHNS